MKIMADPENPKKPVPEDITQVVPIEDIQVPRSEDELAAEETETADKAGSLVGAVINNNYKILEMIQAGGMGEVYKGEQVFTGDPVAIKIVLPSLAQDQKVLTLFKREARILSQLADEAIVRYFNFVHDPELDRFCLIMDFIDGVPLSEVTVEKGPLSLDEARRLLVRLAKGLEKAHAREVTHRDLSPDNVMLPDDNVDHAVLIDFGIAKSTEMTEGTLHGQFAGKFKYISPEQLGHFDGIISPRTDIYGLALLMAASVRGKAIDMGASVVEAVNARRKIPELDGIYPELQPLLAHMLEPDPALRPARMQDVASMVHNPELIPDRYTMAVGATEDMTVIGGVMQTAPPFQSQPRTIAPLSGKTGGIQAPPTTHSPRETTSPNGTSSQDDEATIIGTIPPPAPSRGPVPMDDGGAGFGTWLFRLLLVGALGGGGWYAYTEGLIPGVPGPIVEDQSPDPADDPAEGTTEVAVMPPPDTTTRQGFLAAFEAEGGCSYATRITSGINSGKLEVISDKADAMGGLPEGYGTAFGAQPALVNRVITADQCAALDLTRALQGRVAVEPVLTLDTDLIKSGGAIAGRVSDIRGRTVWLALVSASGGIYNLSDRLTAQTDGSALFEFGMSLGSGLDEESQMIMALASNDPILSLAAVRDGDLAADVLPLIEAEIASRQGGAAASLGWFILQPEDG